MEFKFKSSIEYMQNINTDQSLLDQLKFRLTDTESLMTSYSSYIDELIQICDANESNIYLDKLRLFENDYYLAISKAQSIMKEALQHSDIQIVPAQTNKSNALNTRLPPIELCNFSGEIQDFENFSNPSEYLILNNDSFDAIHKFYYLKGHLTGDAAKISDKLAITSQFFCS